MDITKFDEAIDEIIKYMDYPETDEEKRAYFIRYYEFAVNEM